ncbi:MAG: CDP-glycerol glycerophosphotransferase family protein [Ruminococcus sp.]
MIEKIVVSNFRGKGYGDNPKYIENLRKRKETYKIYWLVEDKNEKNAEEIHVVKINSIASLYHLSTAKIWIDNCRKSPI